MPNLNQDESTQLAIHELRKDLNELKGKIAGKDIVAVLALSVIEQTKDIKAVYGRTDDLLELIAEQRKMIDKLTAICTILTLTLGVKPDGSDTKKESA